MRRRLWCESVYGVMQTAVWGLQHQQLHLWCELHLSKDWPPLLSARFNQYHCCYKSSFQMTYFTNLSRYECGEEKMAEISVPVPAVLSQLSESWAEAASWYHSMHCWSEGCRFSALHLIWSLPLNILSSADVSSQSPRGMSVLHFWSIIYMKVKSEEKKEGNSVSHLDFYWSSALLWCPSSFF